MDRNWLCAALVPLLGLAVGCRQQAAPAISYDRDDARAVLTAALDAWKSGQVRQLARQKPPIAFTDDDLVMGATLISYELAADAQFGPHHDVAVQVVLRDRRGTTVTKQAIYQVALDPRRAVFRNDP
jgi:hypothetical protein